jgi:hypothetical protein
MISNENNASATGPSWDSDTINPEKMEGTRQPEQEVALTGGNTPTPLTAQPTSSAATLDSPPNRQPTESDLAYLRLMLADVTGPMSHGVEHLTRAIQMVKADMVVAVQTSQGSATRSLELLQTTAHETRTLISEATEQAASAMQKQMDAIVSCSKDTVACTKDAGQRLKASVDEITQHLQTIQVDQERQSLTQQERSEQVLGTLYNTATHITASMKKDLHALRIKVWLQATGIGAVTGMVIMLAVTWTAPGWTMSDTQSTLMSAGRIVLEEYHRAEDPRKREIERIMGWKAPDPEKE